MSSTVASRELDGVRARLYDANGRDRDVPLAVGMAAGLKPKQLLWINAEGRTRSGLEGVAAAVGLDEPLVERLTAAPERAGLIHHPNFIHLSMLAMDGSPEGTDASGDDMPRIHRVDMLAGRDWIVTVHDGPMRVFDRIERAFEGETRLGALDAAGFLAAIVDELIGGYFELVEAAEREIDRLDERALRRRPEEDVLAEIVRLRRRIGEIRRTLVPHRAAFAALARPEMELHEELGKPWPGLNERLERAVEAVEGLRDLLLGTFDIYMGRAVQNANEVMKVLTLLSAVLLPAIVLAGVMGMNFQLDFFKSPDHFWLVIGATFLLSFGILGGAKWRGWF